YGDFTDMMELAEDLITSVVKDVNGGSLELQYEGDTIDFTRPWKRLKMLDAIKEYTGLDFEKITTDEEAREAVKGLDRLTGDYSQATRGELINEVFEAYVEEKLVQPTFVYGHTVDISP